MSTTIDSLDIQISTSAGQSSRQIHDLAIALGRLKENGKITASTNGLKKLAAALDTLNPALNSMNAAKLQQLRGAMAGLSNIQKLSGLNSAVNTLKKIPEVVNGLNTTGLDQFEQQMQRLSAALAPLATQIDKIGTGFSKLPKYVGKAVTATNRMAKETEKAAEATEKHTKALDHQGLNIMAAIHNFESMIHVVQMVGDAIQSTMAQAMEWDGIQYRFGRAFGEDAEEVYAYAQKINDVLGINMQQFMQYSSLYGSLLSGFGMAQEKVTTISVGLTELSYDIWAAYNDRFKSLEQASEAVRSAITGEIEPIRNAGIALTEASLQEYLEQVGMAHISIENLSEAQKAEVRYAAMMNAALNQGIVGTYAKEMQTAEGAVRNLSQAWTSLVQAFGSLFIPILQAVIPYLTAIVNLLRDAAAALADFLGIAFFEIDWSNTGLQDAVTGADDIESGLNGAAEAAKKIRDYTMGFDELNIIQPPTETGGGNGGNASDSGWTGLDLETMWDDSVFANASKQVDELKQKIKDWFEEWKTQIAIVGGALASLSMANLLENLGEALGLGDKFLGVVRDIKKMATVAIILTIQYSLMSEYLENFIKTGEWENYVWAAVVGALGAFGSYLVWGKKGLVLSLTITALTSLQATFEDGSVDSLEEVATGLTGVATGAGALALAWPKLKVAFAGIKEFFMAASQMAPEVGWLAALFPKLSSAFATISGAISSAVTAVGAFLSGISIPVWIAIAAAIAAVVGVIVFLKRNWNELTEAAKRFFDNNIAPKLDSIKESWEKMKSAVADALPPGVIEWFKDAAKWIGNLAKGIGEWFKSVDWLDAIGTAFEWIGGIVFATITGPIAGSFNALVQFIKGIVKGWSGVIQVISGMVEFWVALFTGKSLIDPLKKMWSGIKDLFSGMYDATIGVVVSWVKGIIDWFTELWDVLVGHSIVPDMIKAIISWFLSLPSKILSPIQKFVNDVIAKFKNMWSSIKSWWNTSVAPKFTLSYWQSTFNSIVSAISTKLDEAWKKVKTFFSASEWKKKVDSAIQAIKDNFNLPSFPKIKLEVAYDTNVGSIKKAVYEALGLPGWPGLKWTTYATGGFPSVGEMFIAREAGPEMVGSIGNRTAVVNNDQIVEAVSRGVYSAVVDAMRSYADGQSGQEINLYLDGKQITATVEKHQKQRGATLMTGGMAYGY